MNFLQKQLKKINTFWNQRKKIPKQYPFVMHEDEKILFQKYINTSQNYLEFGLGGSTIFTLINSKTKIISVDSNASWINFMKSYKIISQNLSKRLEILKVDIGPTKSWGFPIDDSHRNKFPEFSSKVFQTYNVDDFDLVLVDGRFRVACVLSTIINRKNNIDKLNILVHDYSFRGNYNIIERYLDIVESANSLYVFSIKKSYDENKLKQDYQQYKYNPE